jgi:hypothetical protein
MEAALTWTHHPWFCCVCAEFIFAGNATEQRQQISSSIDTK